MKFSFLTLIQRPSTWLTAMSSLLLIVVLMTPEENGGDSGRDNVSNLPEVPAAVRMDELTTDEESAVPILAKVEAAPVSEPMATAIAADPLIVENVEKAPQAMPKEEELIPKAVPIAPIHGPPDLIALEQMQRDWEMSYQGVPDRAWIQGRLLERFQGPPDLADLTTAVAKNEVGPPSPSAFGPPFAGTSFEGNQDLAEASDGKGGADSPMRGEDSEFAHEEDEVKVSGTKSGIQKPTTRITPPASSPEIAEKKAPEPEPPPLNEETLPPAQGNVWKVVKVEGRDYVTGQSIQLFYRFSTHKVEGNHVWFRNPNLIIKGQIGSQELLVNNIKFVMSYPILYQGGQALLSRLDLCKLIEPVIRPAYIGSSEIFNTVVLDAGHGGHDSGSKGVYGYEKNYALAMVLVVRDALVKRGFKVILTRSNDTFLTLQSRVAIANKTPNSIFISIHFNSGGSAASGIETFALTPQGSASSLARGGGFSNSARVGNQFDSENIALATAVHAQVVHRFKLIDRGIKRARWTVLTGCNRPGILFEGGFVTNARECQLIASDAYRKALAEAIGDAVNNYRKALAPKPAGR
jgi:N-acetylmuramoyl-L-alanine amidase